MPQGRLIAIAPAGRGLRRLAALAAALALPALAEVSTPPATSGVAVEVGFGHESQTSPLFRVSPEGTLIRMEGVDRLAGAHYQGSLSGFADFPVGPDWRLALGGDIRYKRAPGVQALDFAMASVNPMLRTALAGGFFGIGPNLQRTDVAGERFRSVRGWHADWAAADLAGNNWQLFLDRGTNRHWGDLIDLDSTATLFMVRRRQVEPLPGIDAIDVEAAVGRERNDRGFAELSNRYAFLRVSLDRRQWGVGWSLGMSWQTDAFDDTALPGLPARRDRSTTLEFAAAYEIAPGHTLKFEATGATNRANLELYENRYRQFSLAYGTSW